MMGLQGLVTSTTTTRDGGGGGGEETVDWVELVNASFELLTRVRELHKTKRERDEYAQQLLQDLQRCQVQLGNDNFKMINYYLNNLVAASMSLVAAGETEGVVRATRT